MLNYVGSWRNGLKSWKRTDTRCPNPWREEIQRQVCPASGTGAASPLGGQRSRRRGKSQQFLRKETDQSVKARINKLAGYIRSQLLE